MDLQLLKKKLQDKEIILQNRVEALAKDRSKLLHPNSSEQALELENSEVVSKLESIELKELARVRSALIRMDQSDYGICASCEEPISDARLNAVPEADCCVKCQSDFNH